MLRSHGVMPDVAVDSREKLTMVELHLKTSTSLALGPMTGQPLGLVTSSNASGCRAPLQGYSLGGQPHNLL